MTTNEQQWQDLAIEAGRVFTPTSPIDERSLFAGREEQVRLVVDVVNQKGQHAILYGERGVGKTSLANVLSSFLGTATGSILAPRVNCDTLDSFESVWRKAFEQIHLTRRTPQSRFEDPEKRELVAADELLGEGSVTPDTVRRALTVLSQTSLPIFIIDEFDRLAQEPRRAFADTVKTLSDHAVRSTVILVGVADSVDQLFQEHESVERALVQIQMPRMSPDEIDKILSTGVGRLGMSIEAAAANRVVKLSQGLPHYAHLLGLYATRAAIDGQSVIVTTNSIDRAIDRAINGAQQSIRGGYEYAVRSPRKDNLFADVLLSCALATANELGFFAAQDVREQVRKVTGKKYEIPSFAQHLNEFCDEKRGPIFQKTGSKRRFRYRFLNPLMQPYVIMQGLRAGRINTTSLD